MTFLTLFERKTSINELQKRGVFDDVTEKTNRV